MLKAEQVPNGPGEAYAKALTEGVSWKECFAAAINAWPGMEERVWWNPGGPQITLPLPQEGE